jgi:hypothetical protein
MSQDTHKLARKVVSLAALVVMTVPALAADSVVAQPDPLWIWVGILVGGIAVTTGFLLKK